MVSKGVMRQLEQLRKGDLVCVSWCDASVGKASGSGSAIDVPVKSWGVYVGVFGEKAKHIVLAQNSFRYADGLYDLDYTAIPLGWTFSVEVVGKSHLPEEVASALVNSFLLGGRRMFNRARAAQQRVNLHGGLG
jgi:hypothetical protein